MSLNAYVVFAYLIATIGLGVYLSKFIKKDEDFFLAGRSLNKWVIAGMIMATNVAAIYLVGPAGAAYGKGGVSVLLIAWTGNMIAAISALVFVPRLRRLRITTVSELIEKRYNVGMRLIVSLMWILYYALFAGNAMYTLSVVLAPVMGVSPTTVIWFVSGAVILYCFFSGLMAAAYSSVIQSFLMIIGGLILLPLCLKNPEVGGMMGLTEKAGEVAMTFWKNEPGVWPNYKHIIMFALLGLPYWCTSQYMLQCSFAGKNVRASSRGLIIAGMITGVLTLAYIIPGMCGRFILGEQIGKADTVLPQLLNTVLPVGVGGIILAALVAASNSTAAALLNAAATLSEHDFFRRFFPKRSSKQYLWFGRIAIVICGIIGLLFALQVDRLGGIIKANFTIMSLFEPPIFVIIVGALLFRWANRGGALAALLGGIVFGALSLKYEMSQENRTFLSFPISGALLVIGSVVSNLVADINAKRKDETDSFMKTIAGQQKGDRSPMTLVGIAMALISLLGFVLAAVFESYVPRPANIFLFMGLMLSFVFGCYLATPMFVPDENEDSTSDDVELTGIRGFLASGKSWAAMGVVALVLVVVLYLI